MTYNKKTSWENSVAFTRVAEVLAESGWDASKAIDPKSGQLYTRDFLHPIVQQLRKEFFISHQVACVVLNRTVRTLIARSRSEI